MNGIESERSRKAATGMAIGPVFLKALYIHCSHCDGWAPSPTAFWYFDAFERARRRATPTRCRRCGRTTMSNEQRYRAFLENGDCREGC